MRLATRHVGVGGLRIHERLGGGGARLPVVGVHGLGVSSRHLLPSLELLWDERPVYAPDLPGFGASGRPAEVLGVAEHAAFLGDWFDTVALNRAVLLANSMGCQVATELALRAPDRVAALVLVGPTADPSAPTIAHQFARLALDSLRETPRLDFVVASAYLRAGPRRTLATARLMLAHRLDERLPLVGAPVVVVRGERDPIVSAPWAERLAELAGTRLRTVPGAAHCAHFTAPWAVVAEVRAASADGD
jgi:pimeloyl-ACP methyl ester carboxylesterase